MNELMSQNLPFKTAENLRFSILEALVLTGSIAASLALLLQFGIIAALIVFAVCSVASLLLLQKYESATRAQFWLQFLWCVLLPVVCVFGDPFVFGEFRNAKPIRMNHFAGAFYAMIAWQVFLMMVSWSVTPRFRRINGFLGGSFLCAAGFAWLIAFALIPASLLGMLALVGVLGTTPWITGIVFFRSAMMHLERSRNAKGNRSVLFTLIGISSSAALFVLLLFLIELEVWDFNSWVIQDRFDSK